MPRKPRKERQPMEAEGLSLHMTFRLSPELRDRLATAAGDRPIGDEIRRRLEESFPDEPSDPETGRLLAADAAILGRLGASWHTNPDAYARLRRAREMVLGAFKPGGEPSASDTENERAAAMLAGIATLELTLDEAERLLGKREEEHKS